MTQAKLMRPTLFAALYLSMLTAGAQSVTVMAQAADADTEVEGSVLDDLIFTPQGTGEWQVGRGLPSIPASTLSINYSSELDDWNDTTPLSGRGCETAGVRTHNGLSLMIEQGIVTRIDVWRPSDDAGKLGFPSFTPLISGTLTIDGRPFAPFSASIADARAAFGPSLREEPHPYVGDEGSYLILFPESTPGFGVILETVGDDITSFRVGNSETIQYIEGCL